MQTTKSVLRHRNALQRVRRGLMPEGEDRRGAALVEFAIMAPLMLTLVLGVVEMGNALDVSNKMQSAIREGGRLAAMDWTDIVPEGVSPNDKVISDIKAFLQASGIDSEYVTISITHAEGASQGNFFDLADPDNMNQLFQISASIDYANVSDYPANFMTGQTLVASITLRAGRISLISG